MRRQVVYAVQINSMCGLLINVTCPNCNQEFYIKEEDDERKCASPGCENMRFKLDLHVSVYTGIKEEDEV